MHKSIGLLLMAPAWVAAAMAAVPAVPTGRLPDTVAPIAYRIDLTIDPSAERFRGHTDIDARLARPSAVIFLHGNGLEVTRARISAGGKTFSARYTEVDPTGVARLDLPSTLPAGKIKLSFDYSGGIQTSAEGLFHAKVGEDWYAWTQMESTRARRVFPGFDEPGFKTPMTVNVTAPAGDKVFSNAPEKSTARAGVQVIHHFAPTKPLPTYLVAIGVGPFDVVETTVPANAVRKDPLAFRVIATKGQSPRMQFAATEGPKLLGLLEAYFKSPYPFEKLDFLASPIQPGAMENAGLIIYADSLILLDSDAPSRQLRSFGNVVAHEMAHQWVGDLVTPTWWTDIWLNESFAQWMGDKTANQWRPELGFAASELSDAFDAMDDDALGHGRPIHQAIDRNTDIDAAFDSITYEKGAQVLSMFETYLGAEAFADGVRRHLNAHRYGNATADDFFRSLGEAAGNDKVVPAMRTFTDQTGVPVVTVGEEAQSVTLAQTRYRLLGEAVASNSQSWMIPLCLSRSGQRKCALLDTPSASIADLPGTPGAALMPDADGAGYFRFSLDAAGWDRLIGESPGMAGREAMAVADNLWADFAAGRSSFERVVRGARTLANNPERLAAIELGIRLQRIATTLLTPEQLPAYRRLMASIYGPRLAGLGTDISAGSHAGEPVESQALRESLIRLVAGEARDPKLRAELASAAAAYLDGDSHALDTAFRRTAFAVAVQDGGVAVMTRLKGVLLETSDPLLKNDASVAIGAADTRPLAESALSIAFSPGVPTTQSLWILFSLSSQPGARETTTTYIENNWVKLMDYFPGPFRPFMVRMFEGYCGPGDAAQVEAFFRPKLEVIGTGGLELAQTEERIGLCSALKTAKGAEIRAALAQ